MLKKRSLCSSDHEVTETSVQHQTHFLGSISCDDSELKIVATQGGLIVFKSDSGAGVTVISEATLNKIKPKPKFRLVNTNSWCTVEMRRTSCASIKHSQSGVTLQSNVTKTTGFRLLLRFTLATMLTFCIIIKKTGPSKILKLLTCRFHHLIDMLIEFRQSLILLTHLKCLNVPYP